MASRSEVQLSGLLGAQSNVCTTYTEWVNGSSIRTDIDQLTVRLSNWNELAGASNGLLPTLAAGAAGPGIVVLDGISFGVEVIGTLAAPEVVLVIGAVALAADLYSIYQGKGERKLTGKPEGTPNPGKKARPSRKNPGRYEVKDPHTGKWKLKPPGWVPVPQPVLPPKGDS